MATREEKLKVLKAIGSQVLSVIDCHTEMEKAYEAGNLIFTKGVILGVILGRDSIENNKGDLIYVQELLNLIKNELENDTNEQEQIILKFMYLAITEFFYDAKGGL